MPRILPQPDFRGLSLPDFREFVLLEIRLNPPDFRINEAEQHIAGLVITSGRNRHIGNIAVTQRPHNREFAPDTA